MKKIVFLFLLLASLGFTASADNVDTVAVRSASMGISLKNVIVLPDGYQQHLDYKYPVVYLLHGYGGDYAQFINVIKKNLPELATQYGFILVCPDGRNSWYWDSPVNPKLKFETYIVRELLPYVDSHYRTIHSRKYRAVTGFSMGGEGAFWLAIRHQDLFSACGSMSGGVDVRPFPHSWELKDYLGTYHSHRDNWNKHVIKNILSELKPDSLAIIFDCGSSDFFYKVNLALHNEMLKMNIPHDFIVRPGKHEHRYWTNAIDYQLLFFSKHFQAMKTDK